MSKPIISKKKEGNPIVHIDINQGWSSGPKNGLLPWADGDWTVKNTWALPARILVVGGVQMKVVIWAGKQEVLLHIRQAQLWDFTCCKDFIGTQVTMSHGFTARFRFCVHQE